MTRKQAREEVQRRIDHLTDQMQQRAWSPAKSSMMNERTALRKLMDLEREATLRAGTVQPQQETVAPSVADTAPKNSSNSDALLAEITET